jgi:hypothetical protein
MNFTRENVENYWRILNSSHSIEDKKVADEYLIHFKVRKIGIYIITPY